MELWFLFSAYYLIILYICTKFCQISHRIWELLGGHDFHCETAKRTQVELGFLISARPLMMLYICTKFRENISQSVLQLLRGHGFPKRNFQRGHNSVKCRWS